MFSHLDGGGAGVKLGTRQRFCFQAKTRSRSYPTWSWFSKFSIVNSVAATPSVELIIWCQKLAASPPSVCLCPPAGLTETSSPCGSRWALRRWWKAGTKACRTCAPERRGSWSYLRLWPTGRRAEVALWICPCCMLSSPHAAMKLCDALESLQTCTSPTSHLFMIIYDKHAHTLYQPVLFWTAF